MLTRKLLLSLTLLPLIALIAPVAAQSLPEDYPQPDSEDATERGEYLFRLQFLCISCHLGPNEDGVTETDILKAVPSGGELFEMNIAVVTSSNLTTLQNWTDEEIEQAIRFGIAPDNRPLLPAMAYSLYEEISDDDMNDLISYIRTLAPIDNEIAAPQFAFAGMSRQDFAFAGTTTRKEAYPIPENILQRGIYLANTASCMHCHGEVGEDMIPLAAPEGLPLGWIAPPLMPAFLDTIYTTEDDLYTMLRSGQRPDGSQLGAFMSWHTMAAWPEEDIKALMSWLESLDNRPPAQN